MGSLRTSTIVFIVLDIYDIFLIFNVFANVLFLLFNHRGVMRIHKRMHGVATQLSLRNNDILV